MALSSSIFDKFCTLNFLEMTTLGIKHISAAFMGSYSLVPSNTLIICSKAANFSRAFFFYHLVLLRFFHYKVNGRQHSYKICMVKKIGNT